MIGQDYIDKTREYLNYIEEHLKNVQLAFTEVSDACEGMQWVGDDYSWHIVRGDVMAHDLSKFSKEEFTQYRDSFFPVNGLKKNDSDFCSAWENHKLQNSHHHETVQNYLDIVHMVIDWTAMGYKFGDTAQEYYERNKDKIILSEQNIEFLNEVFDKIKEAREKVI